MSQPLGAATGADASAAPRAGAPAERPASRGGAPEPGTLLLHGGLRRVWRGPGRLQVGVDPGLGAILTGLTAAEERLVESLDRPTTPAAYAALAERLAVPASRASALLQVLTSAGALVPGPTSATERASLPAAMRSRWGGDADVLALVHPGGDGWDVLAARRRRCVLLAGGGRTGARIAVALAAAGVGAVVVEDEARVAEADVAPGGYRPRDVGRRRADAAADLVREHAPGAATSAATARAQPDLVVLSARDALDPRLTAGLLAADLAHLAVVLRERDAVVGPLVVPGRGPCLRCLDLHRRSRDPEWPRVLAQLVHPARPAGEESTLSASAAALATAQALAWLDRRPDGDAPEPASRCATLELGLPDGTAALRTWTAHPECGCTWPPRHPLTDLGAPSDPATATMADMAPRGRADRQRPVRDRGAS